MKKTFALRLTWVLITAISALLVWFVLLGAHDVTPLQAQTNIIRVAPSGEDAIGCGAAESPCRTLQYAVNRVVAGGEIRVASLDVDWGEFPSLVTTTARYVGTGDDVIRVSKSITVRGGYIYWHGPALAPVWDWRPIPATVDGEGVRRVLSVEGTAPTFEFLSFVNGSAEQGGNVYAEEAAPIFRATTVMSGNARLGGGLYLKECSALFDFETLDFAGFEDISALLLIQDNSATEDGGGVYIDGGSPTMAGVIIQANHANGRGGGVFATDSAARVAGALIVTNTAASGGGVYFDGPLVPLLTEIPIVLNTYVRHNQALAGEGGGLYMHQAIAGMVNNVIADNQASEGAGLYLYASSPQLYFTTLAQNRGASGVYVTHKPGSLWPPVVPVPSLPSFTNTLITSHTVGFYVDSTGLPYPLQNRVTLQGTLWWGNGEQVTGPGERQRDHDVVADPQFTCTDDLSPRCLRPYHLTADSPAVDEGVDIRMTLPGTDLLLDIDGQLRPVGEGYDLGADEVQTNDASVSLVPALSVRAGRPGRWVTHTHWLLNTQPETASMMTYDLTAHGIEGWPVQVEPVTAALSAQSWAEVHVRVRVPETVTEAGLTERVYVTATARGDSAQWASAQDFTTVISPTDVDLGITKRADVTWTRPGEAVFYTLDVTATGMLHENTAVTLSDRVMPTRAIAAWQLPPVCSAHDMSTGRITCTLDLPKGSVHLPHHVDFVVTTSQAYTRGILFNSVTLDASVSELNMLNNVAEATVVMADCISITDVMLEGASWGWRGEPYTFTASIAPENATLPIVYTWRATSQPAPVVHTDGVTDTAAWVWDTSASHSVTVTVSNLCSAEITRVRHLDIYARLYLPLVLRGYLP